MKQIKMSHQNRFLTADWNNLLMLNYAADPSSAGAIRSRRYRAESFAEVNLSFYVKRSSRQGVVFIRELVPKYAVAAIVRLTFRENYSLVPMSHRIQAPREGDVVKAEYPGS
jgi:Uncharacterized conserved protein (COG2071)